MVESGGLSVHLHPLVLINVSDHIVRFRHTGRAQQRVLGVLLGAFEARRVDVHTSFELIVQEESMDDSAVDEEFFKSRSAQYLEVFPKYEFIGWYTTGCMPTETDNIYLKKFQELSDNENPFVLLVDTVRLAAERVGQSEELPVKVFDSTTHIDGGNTTVLWKEVPYAIDTLQAERIAINHVAKNATAATAGYSSDFTQHTSGLANSVVMLNNRVKELLTYMEDVKAGRAPKNHDILRQLLNVCKALQAAQHDDMHREFCAEFNDASLVVMLGTLTKVCSNTSELWDKFHLAHDSYRKHQYPRHRGGFPLL